MIAQSLETSVVQRPANAGAVAESHTKSPEPPKTQGPGRRRFIAPPWIALGVLVGMFGLGGFLLWTDVIRLQTAEGEIVIETDDPNVQVEILQEGKLIEILDTRSQRRLKIAAGTYSIQPSRSADDDATFQVSPGVIELTRGQQRIVKISRIDSADRPAVTSNRPADPGVVKPTYQGRTVEDWVMILAVEYDPQTLADGINALSKLMGDHLPQQTQGVELVRKILRQHGASEEGRGWEGRGMTLRSAMDAFFKVLIIPPDSRKKIRSMATMGI